MAGLQKGDRRSVVKDPSVISPRVKKFTIPVSELTPEELEQRRAYRRQIDRKTAAKRTEKRWQELRKKRRGYYRNWCENMTPEQRAREAERSQRKSLAWKQRKPPGSDKTNAELMLERKRKYATEEERIAARKQRHVEKIAREEAEWQAYREQQLQDARPSQND